MKNLVLSAFILFVFSSFATQTIPDCRCKNIPLYGRVKVVSHHADFDVRIVSHHADLHVCKVKNHPDRCGLWQFVDEHPDFTVRLVEHHPDFTVKYVDHHPGMP